MGCKHDVETGQGVLVSEHDIELSVSCKKCNLSGTVIINIDDIEWDAIDEVEEEEDGD